jgi:hypothetical protein
MAGLGKQFRDEAQSGYALWWSVDVEVQADGPEPALDTAASRLREAFQSTGRSSWTVRHSAVTIRRWFVTVQQVRDGPYPLRPLREWSADPPAGTGSRAILPVGDLDPRVWATLVDRVARLPTEHVRGPGDVMALTIEEFRAAHRIGRANHVEDGDQAMSLALRHMDAVHERLRTYLLSLGGPVRAPHISRRGMRWRRLKFRLLMRARKSSTR